MTPLLKSAWAKFKEHIREQETEIGAKFHPVRFVCVEAVGEDGPLINSNPYHFNIQWAPGIPGKDKATFLRMLADHEEKQHAQPSPSILNH